MNRAVYLDHNASTPVRREAAHAVAQALEIIGNASSVHGYGRNARHRLELARTAVANLGWDEVRFPKPLFHGDTIRVETSVIALRESKSRPDQGIVTFEHRAYNQKEELVAICKRSGLQRKKAA